MTNTEQKILDVFKEFKTSRNGVLKPQSLDSRIRSWDRRSQDESRASIQQLISDEYITINDNWYILLDKGYDYISKDYSIEDTEALILDIFRKHKKGIGEMLMTNSFLAVQQSAERFHFDNFDNAFKSLISKGLLEQVERGFRLTQKGYDTIY